ncbi:hypothetical protein BKA82DRAFT_3140188 [Pisolithus tinctorius]|nr:hypothetical protein BKA82DRAFT_3140188 [Pisolithus tinctorius]
MRQAQHLQYSTMPCSAYPRNPLLPQESYRICLRSTSLLPSDLIKSRAIEKCIACFSEFAVSHSNSITFPSPPSSPSLELVNLLMERVDKNIDITLSIPGRDSSVGCTIECQKSLRSIKKHSHVVGTISYGFEASSRMWCCATCDDCDYRDSARDAVLVRAGVSGRRTLGADF